MNAWRPDRTTARRRGFRPELAALEDRALLTQLGAVAPLAAGVVQVQNRHAKPVSVQGLPIRVLAGHWQGTFWFTRIGSEQLGRPVGEGPVTMQNTIRSNQLILDEYRASTQIRNRYTITPVSKTAFNLLTDLDDQYDGGYQWAPEPGRQVGPNSWTCETPVGEEFPGPARGFRRTFTLINRNTFNYTLAALLENRWEVVVTETLHRVPGPSRG